MTIGDYIKEYRKMHDCSMDEFARKSGLSKAYVSILERNYNPSTKKAAIPSLDTIKRVATATGADFNDLIAVLDGDQEILLGSDGAGVPSLPDNIIPMPQMRKIPLVGPIACGTPILAEEIIEDYIDLPRHIHADYALTCKGDSMVNAGIRDGDMVYIRKQEQVDNGQIAAVLVGDDEATLKRFYYDGKMIQLVAENPAYSPKVFYGEEMQDVHVIGLAIAYTHVIQ